MSTTTQPAPSARPRRARPGGADEPRRAARAAGAALALVCAARLRQRPALPDSFDAAGVHPDDIREPRRPEHVPVHHQGRPARRPIRSGCSRCRASRSPGSTPRQRHHRQADRRWLHAGRPRHLGHGDGPLDPRGRRPAGRHRAQRLRLRPFHRRSRRALRRGGARLHRRPGLGRHDRTPGAAHQRLRARHHHGHAVATCSRSSTRWNARASTRGRPRSRSASLAPSLDRARCATRWRAARHARGRHLRALRGDRPGRRAANASRRRTACTSGRTISTRRSSTRSPAQVLPEGERGRAGVHLAHQGGACRCVRYRTRDLTRLLPGTRPAPCAGSRRSPAAPTT